jgi:prevent-host-death family protein
MSILDMMIWKVGEAKQRLSEVLRRSSEEPQRIFSRDRFVAAVVSASLFEEFEQWREERGRSTLAERFDEVRELCAEEGYELDVGERADRESWISDR